jgi:hypothetical protein
MSDPGYLAGIPSHEWIARMSDALAASQAEVARYKRLMLALDGFTPGELAAAKAEIAAIRAASQPQGGE